MPLGASLGAISTRGGNLKIEARNPIQIHNSNNQVSKYGRFFQLLFWILDFEFGICSGFRISNFGFDLIEGTTTHLAKGLGM
jgi:hypothetical protein